jgi:hypothetical protein
MPFAGNIPVACRFSLVPNPANVKAGHLLKNATLLRTTFFLGIALASKTTLANQEQGGTKSGTSIF